jgi:hypothetical protein
MRHGPPDKNRLVFSNFADFPPAAFVRVPHDVVPGTLFPGYDRCVTAIHSQHATNYAVSASWYAVCRLSLRGSSTVSPFWREVVRVGLRTDIDDALTVARVWPFFFITHFPVLMSQAAG